MSKLYPSFSGAVLLIWVAGWTWWLSHEHQQKTEAEEVPVSAFSITHDGFKITSESVFYFNHSESVPNIPADNQVLFQSLAGYLAEHDTVILQLIGTYSVEEHNRSAAPNLGIARAEAIKTVLVEKGAPAERIEVESLGTNVFYQNKGKLKGGVYFSMINQPAEDQLVEKKNPVTGSGHFDLFFYETGEYKLDKSNVQILDSLRNYLRSNGQAVVTITGFSEPAEEKKSSVRLAEMRAKAVRRYLVDTGARRRQIEVKSKPGMATGGQERVVTLTLE